MLERKLRFVFVLIFIFIVAVIYFAMTGGHNADMQNEIERRRDAEVYPYGG